MRIALAGNPNSGKTTMYNALTGKSETVGNWAGVTVDKKEHTIKRKLTSGKDGIIAVDLPGAYSMSPFTSEESITRDYVKNERPDVIINIVDATNLARSLFFTTQLLEVGIPVVVALNKSDVNAKRENKIDTALLSEKLGCPVFETVSTSRKGLSAVVSAAMSAVGREVKSPYKSAVTVTGEETAILADRERFDFVNAIVREVEVRRMQTNRRNAQDKLDDVLTSRWLGIPIFAVVMFSVFMISQWEYGPGVLLADLITGWLEAFQGVIANLLGDGMWAQLLVDGIIGGFIAVVGFLPLVMIMYFLIAILEDCGYMARVAVVLDPIFKRVGLSGRSVISFVIGTGCAVPGVMACRTIRDERERRATAMLAPFMPCGAKLPVIALFAGTFFGDSPWVGTLMYFVAIIVILVSASVINLVTGYKPRKKFFIMELPEYKAPSIIGATFSMLRRGWAYIVKAGTIILVCNFVVNLMQNFTWSFSSAEGNASDSILSTVALPFAYLFAPIVGYVSWQLAAAVITGFIAKENVVGTLAVCYGLTNLVDGGSDSLEIAMIFGGGDALLPAATALAYLMFNLFSPPCFAAIGAMNSEIKSKKWLFAAIGLQLGMGYSIAFLVNFFGTLFTGTQSFAEPWTIALGWSVFAAVVIIVAALSIKNRRVKELKI